MLVWESSNAQDEQLASPLECSGSQHRDGDITNVSSVVAALSTRAPSVDGDDNDDAHDHDEIWTPLRTTYPLAERVEALWRVQLRDPVPSPSLRAIPSDKTSHLPRKGGVVQMPQPTSNCDQRHSRSPLLLSKTPQPAAVTSRLFEEASARQSSRNATAALASIAKEAAELAQCTFSPRTNTPSRKQQMRSAADEAASMSHRGELLYQHHAVKLSRHAAAVREDKIVAARTASPQVTRRASMVHRQVADDTHAWERQRQQHLEALRSLRDDAERAACTATPKLCERSRAIDNQQRHQRWLQAATPFQEGGECSLAVAQLFTPTDIVGSLNSGALNSRPLTQSLYVEDDVLSCVSGSTTLEGVATSSAASPRRWQPAAAAPPPIVEPDHHNRTSVAAVSGGRHTAEIEGHGGDRNGSRCHTLYHQAVLQQSGRKIAENRAAALAVALSDVRRHVDGCRYPARQPLPRHSSPSDVRPTRIALHQPSEVHQRLYQLSETARLKEKWSDACGAAHARTSSPKVNKRGLPSSTPIKRSTHLVETNCEASSASLIVETNDGDDDVVVVYEL